jgi:ATP-dependent helicase/nuclease subunit A
MTRLEHRVILASAGTGKTFQLTNRYIALLARGVEPSAILATTFTRKAAGEILGRILVRLAKAAGGDAKAVAELQEHADPSLDADRCRALLLRVSGELHRLSILTLDAFFLRIAGGMLLDLDTPPGWSMLDEEADAQLRSDAALDAISGMSTVEAVALLERLHQGVLSRRVHDELLSTVGAAHGIYLLTHGNRRAWQALRGDGDPLKAADVERLVEELRGATPPLTKSGKPGAVGVRAMAKELACAERGDWKGFLSGGLVKAVIEERGSYARCAIPAKTEAVYRALIEHAAAVRFRQIGDRTLAMFDLVERFDQSYDAAKREARAYLFDDVPRLLLRQNAAEKLTKLYFRLDGQIDHVLLDEFQDTSMLQFAMIDPILDELMAGTPEGEAKRSVFIVGDVKQSLYGWRGAQSDLLAALSDRWPQLRESTLERTYRSSPVIVEAVNAVFGGLDSNPALAECGAARAVWTRRFREHASARPELPGYARVSVAADRNACSKEAAERVAAILRRAPG